MWSASILLKQVNVYKVLGFLGLVGLSHCVANFVISSSEKKKKVDINVDELITKVNLLKRVLLNIEQNIEDTRQMVATNAIKMAEKREDTKEMAINTTQESSTRQDSTQTD